MVTALELLRRDRPKCRICGQPVGFGCRSTCGSYDCIQAATRRKMRAWDWNQRHPGEPQPERRQTCVVCESPIPDWDYGPPTKVCSAECGIEFRRRYHLAYYRAHREAMIAYQKEYQRKAKEAARA